MKLKYVIIRKNEIILLHDDFHRGMEKSRELMKKLREKGLSFRVKIVPCG